MFVVALLLQFANVHAQASLNCLTDENLAHMQKAVVYVWSPRMVLSATEAGQALAGANALGLDFVPVVDGRLPLAEWHAALDTLADLAPVSAKALTQTRPLCASVLIAKDAYRHFPTGFLIVKNRVHPATLVGAMPAAFWQEGLRMRLADFPLAPSASINGVQP
jgi:hypothetical protein